MRVVCVTRHLTAHFVASGSEVLTECPDCGSERCEIPMVAVTDDGPVLIGLTTACGCRIAEDPADVLFRCAFCVTVLPSDGALIFRHVLEIHDARD